MTVTNRLERLAKRIYHDVTPNILGAHYAWVFAFTEKGKKVCDGPFVVQTEGITPTEAEESLADFPSGEIFILKTRNMAKAKAEIKHILLERGENPDEALKRVLKKRTTTSS